MPALRGAGRHQPESIWCRLLLRSGRTAHPVRYGARLWQTYEWRSLLDLVCALANRQGGKRARGARAGVAAEGAEVKSSPGAASSLPKGQPSSKRRRGGAGGPARDMRDGLECDGVGGLFAALPPDACGIIISYLAQLDLVRIQ
jgi:hypothetical protein